jgi:formate-nitrite transporter family protein
VLLDENGRETTADIAAPQLTEKQQQEAEDRTSVSAVVVHEAIRHDGEEELSRSTSALAWSGLTAGMSMGFSFVGQALFRAHLPDDPWRPLLVSLGYPLGFLIVIIGRQQLFTENTLTAIIPLLARRDGRTFIQVLRLWAVVLAANLVGAHLFAWVVGNTPMFSRDVQHAMLQLAIKAASVSFGAAILRGIFAGWLIAMVVWMLAAVDTGRVAVIVIITYVVGLAELTHIIAGSVEVLFLPMVGVRSWISVVSGYLLPTLLGNIIGGVSLTAAVNHAQVVAGMNKKAGVSE